MAGNTVDIIVRLIDQVSGRMSAITTALNQVNSKGQQVNTTTQALQTGLKGLTAIAVYQSLKQIADGFYEVARAGAEFERAFESFKVMTEISGESYTEMLGQMREASRGTVSDMNLMISANKAMSLGVADSAKELAKLTEVSAVLGRRTGLGQETSLERMMVGIGRMSPRILDDLGIAVNLTRLFKEETGKAASELDQETKIQILLNKVLKDGQDILDEYPDGIDDAASAFERMSVSMQNLKTDLGQSQGMDWLAGVLDRISQDISMDHLISEFNAGRTSVAETGKVLEHFEKQLDDVRQHLSYVYGAAPGLHEFVAQQSEAAAAVDLVTAAYRKQVAAQLQLEQMREFIARNSSSAPFEADIAAAGEKALVAFDELQAAQKELRAAEAFGDPAEIAAVQKEVDGLKNALRTLLIAYNEIAEEKGYDLVDEAAAMNEGRIVAQGLAEDFDLIKEAEDRAKAATKELDEAFEELWKKAVAGPERVKSAISGALEGGESARIDFKVSNPTQYADARADTAYENFQKEIDAIDTTIARYGDKERILVEVAQAQARYNEELQHLTDLQSQQEVDKGLSAAKQIGEDILALTPQIVAAINEINSGGSLGGISNLQDMQAEVRALGEAYNAAAKIAGLPLIDVDALVRGSIAAQDLTSDVDILAQAELRLKTYAEMVGTALNGQTVAMGMAESAVAGFRTQILSAVVAQGALMSTGAQWQQFTRITGEYGPQLEEIVSAGGDAERMYIDLMAVVNAATGEITDNAAALSNAGKEAESLADTIKDKVIGAYESLNGIVSGELKDSLNELSKVGIGEKELAERGVRKDVPAENARRLGALMVEGVKDQPWLAEFIAEAPEAWNEYISAADPAGAAARMLDEFNKGLRPELLDFEALKNQIRENMETTARIEGMGKQITDELIAEMGEDKAGTIQKFVADALGIGFDESGMGEESSAKLLSALTSEDMKLKMQDAGAVNAANFTAGFNDTVPEHLQPFIDLIIAYVTPAVQARLAAEKNASGAK